ncbi:GNAT family N-acetyltransferase [Szabonella alba]|uniref:GNAT family N-acetyltransferase n=1 Tax=Szabonella alba TaxID=2804194 RepID=A0A8K0Y0P7_9RHOB|nr:GNAT family N-acetyltransferase [Szabonella alba]MBL4918046.1 GNAT family N-acetyltransferase [Szabonella alba]
MPAERTAEKPVTIRPLRPGDRVEWAALWSGYLAFYETTLPETVFEATFARLTDPARAHQNAFVAERDGRLIGLVHYIYHAHNWRAEDVCYLQDLFVTPEARGTGAARALIEAVYAAADANGTPAVYWMTQEFNATARRLYDRVAKVTPFVKYVR